MARSPTRESISVVIGPIVLPAPMLELAAQRRAGEDRGVSGDLDVGVDPGGARVLDRDPGAHVADQDPAARLLGDAGEVGAVVDPEVDSRIRGAVGGDAQSRLAEDRQDVAEVVLALRVVVGEPLERLGEGWRRRTRRSRR